MTKRDLSFAIVGGGNGGQAFAAHLSMLGYPTTLYDIYSNTVDTINKQGGIFLQGALDGFAPVVATCDIKEAIGSANVIMVVTPAFAHLDVARKMAEHLTPNQIVILNPGSTLGALEVWAELRAAGVKNVIAETQTLLYACRATKPGTVLVGAVKEELEVSAIPAEKAREVAGLLNTAFGQRFKPVDSVLKTGLSNVNAMVHPVSLLMMASRVESEDSAFDFYRDGMTPSIVRAIEAVDRERLAVARASGVEVDSVVTWYKRSYGSDSMSLLDLMRDNPAYTGLRAPKTLETRYITEDVPYGLVPMYTLGRLLSVDVTLMGAVIEMASVVLGKRFMADGRRADRMIPQDCAPKLNDWIGSIR